MEKHAADDELDAQAGRGRRIGIVVSRFNAEITRGLREGATRYLREKGVEERDLEVVEVPGAFEIPQMARQLIEKGGIDAVVCLGALVRGETPHFDVLAHAVAEGIQKAGLETGIPVTFGILTTNDMEQARSRSRPRGDENKGREAARAALEMARLFERHRRPGF